MKPSAASSIFSTHYSMHSGDERHFALLEKVLPSSTPGSLLIVRSKLSVRPKHLSDRLRPCLLLQTPSFGRERGARIKGAGLYDTPLWFPSYPTSEPDWDAAESSALP